jgi:hypothetical protein
VNKSSEDPEVVILDSKSRIPENLYQKTLNYSRYIGDYLINDKEVSIIELNGDLIIQDYYMKLKLFPISPCRFFVEDIEKYLNIELSENGRPIKLFYDEDNDK